jgi:site-specific recombinase XerD
MGSVLPAESFLKPKLKIRKEISMGELKEKTKKDMELKNLSERTIKTYLGCITNFACHYGKSPDQLDAEAVRDFLYYLLKEKDSSQATISQHYSALKFFYQTTLGRDWDVLKIPRSRRVKKLPIVLSLEEVSDILSKIEGLKNRAILTTIYSGGLRLREALNLEISDIDSQRMMIRVRQGKGNKDRYTLLGNRALEILRLYWQSYRPKDLLFPSTSKKGKPIDPSGVQKAFRGALSKTTIRKQATVHTLRHSFATHLLEAGTEIPYIQNLLGHSDARTTSIYLHVARKKILKVVSPIDLIDKEAEKSKHPEI